jgi:hypothetical protein
MSIASVSSCSCSHPVDCNHDCHGRHCDPSEHVCSIEFLPDDGGLAQWGCVDCTPGQGLPHGADCVALGMAGTMEAREADSAGAQSL